MRTPVLAGRHVVAAALFAVVIIAGAAACGTAPSGASAQSARPASARPAAGPLAGLTADQIVRKAAADLKTAPSVHVAGSGKDSGQTVVFNMTFGVNACTGTLAVSGEGSFVLLRIGKTLWIKPDSQFWRSAAGGSGNPAVLTLLEGKYLRTTTADANLGPLAKWCSPSQFVGTFGPVPAGLAKGKVTTISGQPALELTEPGQAGAGYVSISPTPEWLRITDGSDQMNFTDYNAPVSVSPPPAGQTVEGSQYGF